MDDGNDQQGLFIRRVGDQVFPHCPEPQRPGGQIGTSLALMGKRHESADGFVNFIAHPVGSIQAVGGDVFPDVLQVIVCRRVKGGSNSCL